MKKILFLLTLLSFTALTSFKLPEHDKVPNTITRSVINKDGERIEKTVIRLDGATSREEVIHTCQFLAKEKVQLTFNQLSIGRSFFGIAGKSRIRMANGKIELPNGSSETFKAGGVTNFKVIQIQYSRNISTKSAWIDMVETVN